MFKCAECGKTTQPREFMTKKTLEIKVWLDNEGNNRKDIVKEVSICNTCAGIKHEETV